jgi:2-methylisocitrate lyase-like PEP mutase family enzyme
MSVHDVRVSEFHRLHRAGTFVMANPWDVGTARVLEREGFAALATTSAGFAWTTGRTDTDVGLPDTLEHLREVCASVRVPVNADFEDGFAADPDGVYDHVLAATATGIAGLSVEDSTRGAAPDPLHGLDLAVARVRAARRAIDDSGTGVLLTARSEGFVVGRPDIDDTTRRLRAYAEAGADCLYAPRISTVAQVEAVVAAAGPLPVNLLLNAPFLTVAQAAALGVRRISVGGTLARVAWGAALRAARELLGGGTVAAFDGLPDVEALLRDSGSGTGP